MSIESISKATADILLDAKAIEVYSDKAVPFVSQILSPVYCDTRVLFGLPKQRKQVLEYLIDTIKTREIPVEVLSSVATGAISWGSMLADRMDLPFSYANSKPKAHGLGKTVEGGEIKNKRVLVIEDLISTGGSSINAIKHIREAGGTVYHTVAIMTYGLEKARDNFEEAKCEFFTLTDFKTVLDQSKLEKRQKELISHWNKDPIQWGRDFQLRANQK